MVKFEVDGVMVEITSGDPEIKLQKDLSALVSFNCPCGAKVKIDKDKLRSPTSMFAIPLSVGFEDVKKAVEYAKKWNQFPTGLSEFFRHQRTYLNIAGAADSYGVDINCYCGNCNREFNLPARFTNPVERKPTPNFVEAWQLFDHTSELSKVALTRVSVRYGFKTWKELAAHIDSLVEDKAKVDKLLTSLKKTVSQAQITSASGKDFVRALDTSLNEIAEDYAKETTRELDAILSDVREASFIRLESETKETYLPSAASEGNWKTPTG
jgi:hypothetical protein